jgi:hypothetical protein
MIYILGIHPCSSTTQFHPVNTAPRYGVYSIKQKTKLSNNRQHSYEQGDVIHIFVLVKRHPKRRRPKLAYF